MVESNALLKRRSPKGYRGFESLPHRSSIDGLLITRRPLVPKIRTTTRLRLPHAMTKYIAAILCLGMLSCASTTAPRSSANATKGKRRGGAPSLDRTYDWGARPPVENPDHEKD